MSTVNEVPKGSEYDRRSAAGRSRREYYLVTETICSSIAMCEMRTDEMSERSERMSVFKCKPGSK